MSKLSSLKRWSSTLMISLAFYDIGDITDQLWMETHVKGTDM